MNYFYQDTNGLYHVGTGIVSPGNHELKRYSNDTIIALEEVETGKVIFGPIEVVNILKEDNTSYSNLSELLLAIKDFFNSSVIDNSFKITINTVLGTGNNFQLPLPSGQTYAFDVDWGDGNSNTITTYDQAETLHNYSGVFNGQISITGKCGGWSFNNLGDRLKFVSVDQWGDVGFDFVVSFLHGCRNLTTLPTGNITGMAGITNMQSFTHFGNALVEIPDGFLDLMPNITNVSSMFEGCNTLLNLPNRLFYNNKLIVNYTSCLRNAFGIALPSEIFDLTALSIVTNFDTFMQEVTGTGSNTGTIQDIWNYALSATSVSAFFNQTGLTNYPSIPNSWKGL